MARSIFGGADGEGCDKRHSDICSAPTDVTLHPCGSWFREITLEQSSERVEECTAEKKERGSEIMSFSWSLSKERGSSCLDTERASVFLDTAFLDTERASVFLDTEFLRLRTESKSPRHSTGIHVYVQMR